MKARAQLDHVLLDVDFLHKPTVIGFRSEHGWNAIPWLFEIYALMSRATDGQISDKVAIQAARDMQLENGAEMIAYCIEEGLIEREDGYLINSRVIRDQERLAKVRGDALERKGKFIQKQEQNAIGTRSPDTDTVTDTESKSKKETANLPESLNTPDHHAALKRWANYTKKLGKPLDQLQMETLALNWAGRPKELILGINQSIERGYRKIIYEPMDEKPPNVNQKMQNGAVSIADSDHPAAIAERRRKENERRQNV